MKRILSLVFVSLVLFSFSAGAQEEMSAPVVSVTPPPENSQAPSVDFQFSHAAGPWGIARLGSIFSTGTHPADFTLPSLKEEPSPIRYPRWAVREGWQGKFVIAVEVLTTGEVGRWKVTESTGFKLLDEAATQAIQQWKFYPATEEGKPVVMCIQIPVFFQLTAGGEHPSRGHHRSSMAGNGHP